MSYPDKSLIPFIPSPPLILFNTDPARAMPLPPSGTSQVFCDCICYGWHY